MKQEIYDVAIIGGGPAGSTAATLLAQASRKVIVLEREKFPRFHIGESLLPFSMKAFTRLGLREKFQRAGFMKKYGGAMYGASKAEGVSFYFEDGFQSQTDHAYQVPRAQFDQILLENARENGAEVFEETAVQNVEFSAEGARLKLVRPECAPEEIGARYVIDASGRNSILALRFKLKKSYNHLQKLSLFAHYDGAARESGRDGTLTRMVRALDRWFWIIPLSETRTSIGLVLDASTFKRSGLSPEEFFEQALRDQPHLADRLENAERVTEVYSAADFSYRSSRLAGDRWLLAGDAAGFIDPVFSSGVFLAILGGEQAADALNVVLDHPRKQRRLFARYEKTINKAMDVYLKFVNAWYTKEFMEVFLNPQDYFQIPPAVNAVLGGNVGNSFAIKWRMAIFYTLVFLQRFYPFCPRLTLVPEKKMKCENAESLAVVS